MPDSRHRNPWRCCCTSKNWFASRRSVCAGTGTVASSDQQQQQQTQATSAAQQPVTGVSRMRPRKAAKGRIGATKTSAAPAVQPAAVALQHSQPAAQRPAAPGAAQPMRAGGSNLGVASCCHAGQCCLLLLFDGLYSAESVRPICMHDLVCDFAFDGLLFMSLLDSLAPHPEKGGSWSLEPRSLSLLCQGRAGAPNRQPTSQLRTQLQL